MSLADGDRPANPDARSRVPEAWARFTRERIEVAHLRAVRRRAEDPVVLALDLHDPRGRAIAEAAGRGDETRAFLAVAEGRGLAGALFWGLPWRLARSIVAAVEPAFAAALVHPPVPAGYFRVLAVTAGELAILGMPDESD